jgi:GABA(A) receptor-associated protein
MASSSLPIVNSSDSCVSESLTYPSIPFSKKKIEELLNKYPNRVPIVISSKSFKTQINRFIVPLDMTVAQFIVILRNKTKLKPEEALYIFIKDCSVKNKENGVIAPSSESMGSLYEKYKDDKLLLNLVYEKESVFG